MSRNKCTQVNTWWLKFKTELPQDLNQCEIILITFILSNTLHFWSFKYLLGPPVLLL